MCGFSKLVCKVSVYIVVIIVYVCTLQIFEMHGVKFKGINILDDEALRQGVKEFSEWPTIPQVSIMIIIVLHNELYVFAGVHWQGIRWRLGHHVRNA
jgi:glutaredoxin-related protein